MLTRSIAEGWVAMPYSRRMNESFPSMNEKSPGRPYFTDVKGARRGQWVRIVLRTKTGREFWCVADVAEVIDAECVRFDRMGYENGDPPPRAFKTVRWRGEIRRDPEGWHVATLEPGKPKRARPTRKARVKAKAKARPARRRRST